MVIREVDTKTVDVYVLRVILSTKKAERISMTISIEGRKAKPKQFTFGQSQQTKTTQRTNENSKQMHLTSAKRGKTRATKSRLVLVLHLIG